MAIKLGVKKGDTVLVIAGKDKGRKGKVLQVLPKENKVIVERINVVKKHQKPSQKVLQGGIVDIEAPIHVSNVQVVCVKCNDATRTGIKELENGKKVRYCKSCGEVIDK
jgi:large subunit ribosomal protein L24